MPYFNIYKNIPGGCAIRQLWYDYGMMILTENFQISMETMVFVFMCVCFSVSVNVAEMD